ncbi:MAG TPA: transglycosylase SLT domain-containing protein [Oleiagrimonas sp.]|nr:transglycosylase SLT domain-containing protein [Oleiagrimonas sp.]
MLRRLFSLRPVARLALLTCGLLACVGSAHAATDASLKAQRDTFKKAYAAARHGDVSWHDMAARLKFYPLYAWLPAAAMEHDLDNLHTARVQRYLKRYDGLLPAYDLRRHFLLELVRRKDWSDFQKLYRPGLSTNLSCYALQARLAQGDTLQWKDIDSLWKHAWLPNSCTPIQKWAHAHGLLTTKRLWQRINAAVADGRGGTVAWLTRWLHGSDQTQAQHLAQALRHPTTAAKAASDWADNARNREAATLAMVQVARANSTRADHLWPELDKHFTFSDDQTHRIRAAMALYVATDFSSDALHRLASLPTAAQTDSTRAWRVRVALARQDWPAAMQALDALSPEQKKQGEWRYWRARALDKLGHHKAAQALYAKQARQATYYGFLAADRADLPYEICPHRFDADNTKAKALLHQPGLQRAFELFAVGMLHDARRVWNRALDGQSTRDRQLAAHVAWKRGWYDRAIRTFSYGQLKHLYQQRFPLARQDGVSAQADDAGIDPAWAYAIIRAESAWMPDARSGADARGLMQLLPSTARLVSRRQNIAFDGNLYDPRTNIELGTHYLAHMAARYGGAPYLATAAYNAGPGRVDDWLSERGQLPPDMFVATIPFHETRSYVARVLAYSVIYDWLLHGNAVALGERMPRYGKAYTPPDADTPRKKVVCPARAG